MCAFLHERLRQCAPMTAKVRRLETQQPNCNRPLAACHPPPCPPITNLQEKDLVGDRVAIVAGNALRPADLALPRRQSVVLSADLHGNHGNRQDFSARAPFSCTPFLISAMQARTYVILCARSHMQSPKDQLQPHRFLRHTGMDACGQPQTKGRPTGSCCWSANCRRGAPGGGGGDNCR